MIIDNKMKKPFETVQKLSDIKNFDDELND